MTHPSINKGTRVTVTLGMILFGVFFAVAYFWNDIQAEAKVIQADLKLHKVSAGKGFEKLAETSAEEINKLITKSDQKFTKVMATLNAQLVQNANTLGEIKELRLRGDMTEDKIKSHCESDRVKTPADVEYIMRAR